MSRIRPSIITLVSNNTCSDEVAPELRASASGRVPVEVELEVAELGRPVVESDGAFAQRLPQLSGIEVMRRVRPHAPGTRFLVLTTYDTDEYIAPALAAGAQGYLLKDAEPEDLFRAIRALMQGGAALEPKVAARVLGHLTEEHANEELSEREMEVLRLLPSGASNKAIALQLGLSENTIKSHISHIFGKLGVQNRAEAVSSAVQRGLLQLR